MKNKFKTAICLLAMGLFIVACSDDDGDDAAPTNNNGGGGGGSASVNKYNGSASYGDILNLEVDQSTEILTVNNMTTGITESNSYSELDAALDIDGTIYDVYEGIYEIDEGSNGRSYAIEIADRILAGNFPTGRPANDIFLAVTDEVDYTGRESEMVGTYFYVSLEPNAQANGENEWGMFTIDMYGDVYGFWCDEKTPGDTTVNVPIDSATAYSIYQGFHLKLGDINGSEFAIKDHLNQVLDSLRGYVYIGGESSAIMIDQGTGEGALFAFKSDLSQANGNENFSKYVDTYKYVDFYENFTLDKGAGNFKIYPDKTFDLSLIGYDTDPSVDDYYVDATAGASMSWTGFPGVYESSNWDSNGSTLYHVFAGDFVMYFDYDVNDQFKGYGIGGHLD
jgi:hypothetical protein